MMNPVEVIDQTKASSGSQQSISVTAKTNIKSNYLDQFFLSLAPVSIQYDIRHYFVVLVKKWQLIVA